MRVTFQIAKLYFTLRMDVMSLRILCQAGLKHVLNCQFTAGNYACRMRLQKVADSQLKCWRACRDALRRRVHSRSRIKLIMDRRYVLLPLLFFFLLRGNIAMLLCTAALAVEHTFLFVLTTSFHCIQVVLDEGVKWTVHKLPSL